MRPKSRSQVLIVGYGFRGRQWHDALRLYPRARTAGVVDPDPDRRADALRAGLPGWGTIAEAFDRSEAHAAIIASPHDDHEPSALQCLESGVAVLVEKPLALSLRSAVRIADEAAARGVPTLVGQNFRFRPHEIAVRRLLTAVGTPVTSIATVVRPDVNPGWDPLWTVTIHYLDLLRTRFGMPETVTSTRRERSGPGRQDLDIRLEWPGGMVALHRYIEGAAWFHYQELVEGTEAAIVAEETGVRLLRPDRRARRVRLPRSRPRRVLLDALVEALRGRPALALSTEDNLATVAVAEAAVRSISEGGPLALSEVALDAGIPARRIGAGD